MFRNLDEFSIIERVGLSQISTGQARKYENTLITLDSCICDSLKGRKKAELCNSTHTVLMLKRKSLLASSGRTNNKSRRCLTSLCLYFLPTSTKGWTGSALCPIESTDNRWKFPSLRTDFPARRSSRLPGLQLNSGRIRCVQLNYRKIRNIEYRKIREKKYWVSYMY